MNTVIEFSELEPKGRALELEGVYGKGVGVGLIEVTQPISAQSMAKGLLYTGVWLIVDWKDYVAPLFIGENVAEAEDWMSR